MELEAFFDAFFAGDPYTWLTVGMAVVLVVMIRKSIRRNRTRRRKATLKICSRKEKNFKTKYWYPTGWTWNDETQLWEPPDYLNEE